MLRKLPLDELAARLSSDEAAPGGGSASAAVASLGAGLLIMTCNFTVGREKYRHVEDELRGVREELEALRVFFLASVDRDSDAYNAVVEAMALPKATEDERAARRAAIQGALRGACEVPLEVAKRCERALALAVLVAEKGNPNTITDTGCGAHFLASALHGALYNVEVNLTSIKDDAYVQGTHAQVQRLKEGARMSLDRVTSMVESAL